MPRQARLTTTALAFAVCLPSLVPLVLILRYGVDVPYYDDWDIAVLLTVYKEGDLSFEFLLSQANEHRIFFPRLLFLGMAMLAGWDLRIQMLASWLLVVGTAYAVGRLAGMTLGASRAARFVPLFIANLFLFAAIQYENWLWGMQLVMFLPIAAMIAALAVARSGLGDTPKLLLCTALAVICTFSFGNGLLVWPVLLPLLAVTVRRRALLGLFGLAAVLSVFVYFRGYFTPPAVPPPAGALEQPLEALRFLLIFLGLPLAHGTAVAPIEVAPLIGGIALCLVVSVAVYVASWREAALVRDTLPWFALVSFVLLSGAAATVARAGWGAPGALALRYTTVSLLLYVGLTFLIVIVAAHARDRLGVPASAHAAALAATAAVTLTLHLLTLPVAVRGAYEAHRQRLTDKAALTFYDHVHADYIAFDRDSMRPVVLSLDAAGHLRPGLARSPDPLHARVGGVTEVAGAVCGHLDIVTRGPADDELSGWAVLPWRKSAADAVLFTYEDGGQAAVFAVAKVGTSRSDVARHFRVRGYAASGWQHTLPHAHLPVAGSGLRAWAYDTSSGRACPLVGEVPRSAAEVTVLPPHAPPGAGAGR